MEYIASDLEKVVQGLKCVFNSSDKEVAKTMRDAKYAEEKVAKGIKKVYKLSNEAIADALAYAGFNTEEIDNALMSIS